MNDNIYNVSNEANSGSLITSSKGTGIFALPLVGQRLAEARTFFDHLSPKDDDSVGVRFGKHTLRYGAVAGSGLAGVCIAAIVAL